MRWLIFTILLVTVTMGCSDTEDYELEESVTSEMLIYFYRFSEEAEKRGFVVDWSEENISTVLTELDEGTVGQCLTYEEGRNQVNIDLAYWNKSDPQEREFLLFHELGHCVLKRSHLNLSNGDGTCTSIMNSGESACQKNYTTSTREAYLDELFS